MVIFGERRTVCSGLVGVRVGCLCMGGMECVLCGVCGCVYGVCVGCNRCVRQAYATGPELKEKSANRI